MFARTERLMLRPGWIEDAPALSRAIGDEAIVRNLAQAPWPYALGDAEAFLARRRDALLPDFLLFLRTRGTPRLIGGMGLQRDAAGEVEFGYWIARDYWGLGFATEAGRAVMALAKGSLRLRRMVAGHFLDNPASGNVLRKLGFAPTGQILARESRGRGCAVPFAAFAWAAPAARADEPRLAA
ncbi:GNAT family N-acetyltransferase [Sphingomonas profundi]|uniref:GNAT family N-acetyltransferase n=1 Tax=Alterirhizorhabdus profundi TaxID=2681549 RepID=UPI0012E82B45|nr:GNAT family N-acetyltransferase [Sphingomonas profundi]